MFKAIRWEVQVLREEHKMSEGTKSIIPDHQMDVFSYKKMLELYNRTLRHAKQSSVEFFESTHVWLVAINNNWKRRNVKYKYVKSTID